MASPVFLGLECGGTRTVALAAGADGAVLMQREAGPANLRLVTDAQLESHFRALARDLPAPSAIGVGMAGVRDRADCQRVERILDRVWPGAPRQVDHDLESALAAAEPDSRSAPKGRAQNAAARVIILSGTGSCCYGRDARGRSAKVGGWGHLLGDRGSAYDIAFRALREAAHEFDHAGTWSRFGGRALRSLLLNEPNELIAWLQGAGKTEVAALAPEVFAAADDGDRGARRIVSETATILAEDALACARRLVPGRKRVQFVLAGSVVLKQSGLVRQMSSLIRTARPGSDIAPLPRESVWGAVVMARRAWEGRDRAEESGQSPAAPSRRRPPKVEPSLWIPATHSLSPTEQRNPRSERLDRMSLPSAVALMLDEEASVAASLLPHRATLARLIRMTAQSFSFGGRLIYVGAGTSGRLGVLDASECPPTFRTSPELVQGIMAGGMTALHSAVEGAEDDAAAGAQAVVNRGTNWRDVVVGIAASGRTPFVWGALTEARRRGAITALISFNPNLDFRGGWTPEIVLAVDVGPEILTGSTRLKSGTATKLILNQLTTLAMVQSGKVIGNLMVDLNPSNVKLRDRACRIVGELTGRDAETVRNALANAGWKVKETVQNLGLKSDRRGKR